MLRGRYRLGAILRLEQRSTSFRARDVLSGDEIVVRLVGPAGSADERARLADLWQRQLSLPAGGILSMLDFDQAGDWTFATRRWVNGPSLFERLEAGHRPTMQDIRMIADGLFAVAAELHGIGFIHGNISSRNVIFDTSVRPIRIVLSEPGLRTTALSRSRYAGVEVRAGGLATIRADLYSLGVILFECLGEPITGRFDPEIAAQRLNEETGGLAKPLADVLRRLAAIDPERRYRDVDAASAAFQSALAVWEVALSQPETLPHEPMVARAIPVVPEEVAEPVDLAPATGIPEAPANEATAAEPPPVAAPEPFEPPSRATAVIETLSTVTPVLEPPPAAPEAPVEAAAAVDAPDEPAAPPRETSIVELPPEALEKVDTREVTVQVPKETSTVRVGGSPGGAKVQWDGQTVGTLPLVLAAQPFGSHRLRVTQAGYAAQELTIALSGDLSLELALEAVAPAPVAALPVVETHVLPDSGLISAAPPVEEIPVEGPPGKLGWGIRAGSLLLGLAILGLGIVLHNTALLMVGITLALGAVGASLAA
jgi:hypothetical protein